MNQATTLAQSDAIPAIAINQLSKTYAGDKKTAPKKALDSVSFEVRRGEIFGLLGPNGAGKSTLINILAGLVNKSGGSASIWGFDISDNPRNAKASIGIVPQEIIFDPFFSPKEVLEVQAGLYGVPKAERRTQELLRAVRLEDKADAFARSLSGGMKRRLLVAKAMAHSPPILVLDEPTAGVDIDLRKQLWDYVRSLHVQGVTIVLTTHYLEEAEQLCDRIAIINHGKVVALKDTADLIGMAREKNIVLSTASEITSAPQHELFDRAELIDPHTLEISYNKDKTNAGQVLSVARDAGLEIVDVTTREADLEDVFLNLTRDGV
ncbi:MAG: ABC transporter ATP-binding protein [Pseudomonadota bacterium]